MKTLIIKTQEELDNLPDRFDEYTQIQIKSEARIVVRKSRENSSVEARENSSVEAWENSSVVAWENSSVVARGNSSVVAWENSRVVARENSSVEAWENSSVEAWENSSVVAWGNSRVVARGNSRVVARENSSVEAWENSSVEAWENSSVVAWGNSSVEAWENSSVVAWGNSSVEAWGNSSVVAWGNSSVEAWGNSSVEARDCVCVWAKSDFVSVVLFAFACCYALAKAKIEKKKDTATVITPTKPQNLSDWLDFEGIETVKKSVILFKRVSSDYKTQENTSCETLWKIGSTLEHHDWNPTQAECGAGKFHACSTPYFCDEFRSVKNDKYIVIKIKIDDLYFWKDGNYPHKIAFRRGKVLYEVNRFGKKIK